MSDVLRLKKATFPMLTNCKKLPSDVKSISPGINQWHTYSHMHTWMHTHTHTRSHSSAASESNFLCTPSVTASFTPNFQLSLSISPKIKLVYSQSVPACLAACTICCQPGKMGASNSRQEPASTAGTASASSREITWALVKSQRRSVGRFQLPQEMKRWRGVARWWKRETKKGQKLKREVAKPRHVTYTISGISE